MQSPHGTFLWATLNSKIENPMTFLFVQPIFAPDDNQFTRNLNSINSMAYCLSKYPEDVKFAFGGWVSSDEKWNTIENLIKTSFGDKVLILKRFSGNYGKAYVVNHILDLPETKGYPYILSADSDIVFKEPYIFERLKTCAEESVKIKRTAFGLISCAHTENDRHWVAVRQNSFTFFNEKFKIKEVVVWPSTPSGIGGGCWMFARTAWDRQGGYKVQGVYAGDDAYFCLNMKDVGHSWQVADSIAVSHPFDPDNVYSEFKGRICIRDSDGRNKVSIDKQIKEMDEFWKKR